MLKNYVLVITVGQTDLQVVIGEGESKGRHEIEKKHVRAVHQWLLDNPDNYEIVPTPKRRHQHKIGWNGKQPVIELDDTLKQPLDQLKLCVAKLEIIVEDLSHEEEPPRAILLLSTHRDSGNQMDAEPIAAAPLLAKWLKSRFQGLRAKIKPIHPKADEIGWVNYLEDKMTMSGDGPNYPFNRQGAELAVKALRKLSTIKEVDTLVLSDGGGMPELKPILRAAGLLYSLAI